MSYQGQKLFDLLPALYRLRDAQLAPLSASDAAQLQALQAMPAPLSPSNQQQLDQLTAKARGPLQCLLMLVEEQLAVVANNLDQLYDDQFIETCATWVIPYIGDLIGYQAVNGVAPAAASPRAEVGKTISLRRRRGTVLVLEQLARDVTGWGAHAVEFFKLLATTQYMKHIRPHNLVTADLRDWKLAEYIDTGFDRSAHSVDVRNVTSERGRYNISNIGIFLWSLNAYSVTMSPAIALPGNTAAGAPQCFRLSSLGADMSLFNNPVPQGTDITAAARPVNVPNYLRRRVLCEDIQQGNALYYGEGSSLAVYVNGALLDASQIQVCNLSGEDGAWANLPTDSPYAAAIDPELGRIALPPVATGSPLPQVSASFYYGFNGDMGGGEYSRADSFTASAEEPVVRVPGDYSTVSAALGALSGDGVVEITDSGIYQELNGLTVNVNAGGHIELTAADGCRPTLVLGAEITVTGGNLGQLDVNGLLITYGPAPGSNTLSQALVYVPDTPGNQLSQLGLIHCTVVPGWALTAEGAPQYSGQPAVVAELPNLQLMVQKSICGGMRVHELAVATISDSIIDANALTNVAYSAVDGASGGGALTLENCTVIGKIHAALLTLVTDSIVLAELAPNDTWSASLWADRKQQGCVRFSYLPASAVIPRQYECVEEGGSAQPLFYSLGYGDPDYGKLLPSTDDTVRRGADDGGEMGAFHFVMSPARETDLLTRMNEYLPVGLEFGVFYET
ncbi:MAG TPA: hypothetical protein VEG68_03385 [Terriglobales bacterium]|nr:hypothetical protein [Terriglobales bacterium]